MSKWGYGAFNEAHQTVKSFKFHCKRKWNFDTFKSRWTPNKKKYERIYKPKHHEIPCLNKRITPSKKIIYFNFHKLGHWANECPNKKKKPRLSTLFTEDIDPKWWDLFFYSPSECPEGAIRYLDPSKFFDSNSLSDTDLEFSDSRYHTLLDPLNYWEDNKLQYEF